MLMCDMRIRATVTLRGTGRGRLVQLAKEMSDCLQSEAIKDRPWFAYLRDQETPTALVMAMDDIGDNSPFTLTFTLDLEARGGSPSSLVTDIQREVRDWVDQLFDELDLFVDETHVIFEVRGSEPVPT